MTTALVPSSHVTLSPSKAHRWVACPGSIAAEVPYPDTSSKYADEGSAAHLLAAKCLEGLVEARTFIGETFPEYPGYPVTEEMAAHVQLYVDHVRELWLFCDHTWVEAKVWLDLDTFHLPEDIGGTSDAGGVELAEGILHVSDLKFGRGVLVEVEDNEQFMMYALAAYGVLTPEEREKVHTVRMHVVQPRASHEDGPIRLVDMPVLTLFKWAQEVMVPAAWATKAPDAPVVAGEHCKFCKAKPECVAFRDRSFAQMPFTFEEVGNKTLLPILPDQTALTPERVGEIWGALGKFEEWVASFRAFVYNELVNGRPIPGVGLKHKRTNRKWIDDQMVLDAMVPVLGQAAVTPPKPLSVAQLEKVCKKVKIDFPEHLVVKDEGELTLCAEADAQLTLPKAASFSFEDL